MRDKKFEFEYDVFLSHSSKDKQVVRELATRLKEDGLRVWMDEWEIHPGDSIPLAIEKGLETSRALVLVMSRHAVASEWVTLERHTALFRDPTNQQRRFIPLRVDDSDIKDSLKQFAYIDWRQRDEGEYMKLCGHLVVAKKTTGQFVIEQDASNDAYRKHLREMVLERLPDQISVEEEPLNTDGTSAIFKAYDQVLQRYVSIKVPNLRSHQSSEEVASFIRKMRTVSRLKHPNVVSVYAGLVQDGLPMLIQEYIPGLTLMQLIHSTGSQPLSKVCRFVDSIASALEYAHDRNSIHHKLSPDRIMINAEGEPVLTPFRILVEGRPMFESDSVQYDAPEHFFADRVSAQASDQYALGLIAYEMILGKSFIQTTPLKKDGSTNKRFVRDKKRFCKECNRRIDELTDCPAKLKLILKKMLHKNPKKRYKLLHVMRADIASVKPKRRDRPHVRIAEQSFRRCRIATDFFAAFYERLLRDKDVADIFQQHLSKPLEEQHWLLREAIELLLAYSADERACDRMLDRAKQSHIRFGVTREMYQLFVDVLCETVKEKDYLGSDDVVDAWRKSVAPAISRLTSKE